VGFQLDPFEVWNPQGRAHLGEGRFLLFFYLVVDYLQAMQPPPAERTP
jgi:hypothetical protein